MKMTDVCVGRMSLEQVKQELTRYLVRSPRKVVVEIELVEESSSEYQVSIWIPRSDFRR